MLGHGLGIHAGGLFFHCAKRPADGDGRQASVTAILRQIEIADERDAIPIGENGLLVVDLVASGKDFVPVLAELDRCSVGLVRLRLRERCWAALEVSAAAARRAPRPRSRRLSDT